MLPGRAVLVSAFACWLVGGAGGDVPDPLWMPATSVALEVPSWHASPPPCFRLTLDATLCSGPLDVAYVDALAKVFPGDTTPPTVSARSVLLNAARNEHQAFQLVFTNTRGPADMEVLVSVAGASFGPASSQIGVELLTVDYANVTIPANAQGRVGLFPDPLQRISAEGVAVPPGQAVGVWASVAPGTSVQAGVHEGAVHLVWNFTIPDAAHATQLTGAYFLGGTTLEEWQGIYGMMGDRRINAHVWSDVVPRPVVHISPDEGNVTLDTAEYDANIAWLLGRGVQRLTFPSPNGGTRMLSALNYNITWDFGNGANVPVFEGPQLNPRFVRLFKLVNGALLRHVKEKGFFRKMLATFKDEPQWNDNVTVEVWMQLAGLFKSLDPGMRLYQDRFPAGAYTHRPEVYPYVDEWCPHMDQYEAAKDTLADLRRKNPDLVLNVYDNGVPLIDLSFTRTQSFPWMIWGTDGLQSSSTYHAGLRGSLSWYLIDWWITKGALSHNPYANANVNDCCGPTHRNHWAGWGFLFYPLRDNLTSIIDPVTSIRKGLEDTEYFYMLDRLATRVEESRCGGGSCPVISGRSTLERVKEVVWAFPGVGDSIVNETAYTTNITLLHDVQFAIAQEIVRLQES